MIQPHNFFIIQSFMINDLKLKGSDLLIYAIIYGFSQGDKYYNGSIKYLTEFTALSSSTVYESISRLIDKGLIVKAKLHLNDGKKVDCYKAITKRAEASYSEEFELEPEVVKTEVDTKDDDLRIKSICDLTWHAYETAYMQRYQIKPFIRKEIATIAHFSMMKRFVKKFGDKAPEIAVFFMNHNAEYFMQNNHLLSIMCQEKTMNLLYTDYIAGTQTTANRVRKWHEANDSESLSQAERVYRKLNRKEVSNG